MGHRFRSPKKKNAQLFSIKVLLGEFDEDFAERTDAYADAFSRKTKNVQMRSSM